MENKIFTTPKIEVGVWRGNGYFFSILFIIGGFLIACVILFYSFLVAFFTGITVNLDVSLAIKNLSILLKKWPVLTGGTLLVLESLLPSVLTF
jgi:hypothetical protein